MDVVRYLERMAQATNRWPELVATVNGWLQQQTEPLPRITLCAAPRQVVRGGPRAPRATRSRYYRQVLQLDPNNVAVLRLMANFFKKQGQWQHQGQTLQQALNVAVTDVDRKEILTEMGEVLEKRMGEVDQGLGYYKRALDVDPLHLPALEALERIYADARPPTDLVDVLTRKAKALTEPGADRRDQAAHRRALRDRARAGRARRGRCTARCWRSTPRTSSRCAGSSASTPTPRSGPISSASSRCSSTSSRPSASASTS